MSLAAEKEREVRILAQAFAPLDKVALGLATGLVVGGGLLLATAYSIVTGAIVGGAYLSLLGQFLPGYIATWPGAAVGFLYGLVIGFVVGWVAALVKNLTVAQFFRKASAKARRTEKRRFLDYV